VSNSSTHLHSRSQMPTMPVTKFL